MTETAIFAGGCFWCVEAVFQDLIGVEKLESGYIGGHVPDPTYKQVCGGDTGHAEGLRVTFDPTLLTYGDLLDIFFATHDPTQLNRQGNDVGSQYRSLILTHSDAQREAAQASREAYQKVLTDSGYGEITTEIAPADEYYFAEDYHQHYYANHREQGYCAMVAAPKIEKFRKTFASRYR